FRDEMIRELQDSARIQLDLALRNPPSAAVERAREYGHGLMRRIITRAQEAGALRPDWTLEDIAFITWSHISVLAATSTVAPDLWRRNLALIFDGLRAKAAHPLPVPALTEDQLMQAMRG
ncbi:TetR/AcrR family transcriptional regulator, partial [Nocardia salmonicida]